MKGYKKGAIKVFIDYFTFVMVFTMFLLTFYNYLKYYTFLIFLITFVVIFSDLSKIGKSDKRSRRSDVYPSKGFLMGLIGFMPFIIAQIIYPLITFNDPVSTRLKEVALKVLMSPLYNFIKLGNDTVYAYALSSFIVPCIAGLGYYAGFHDFDISAFLIRLYRRVTGKAEK